MGEKQNQPFQLSFNASLRIDFQRSRVTEESRKNGSGCPAHSIPKEHTCLPVSTLALPLRSNR
jgi:hypothetical protein